MRRNDCRRNFRDQRAAIYLKRITDGRRRGYRSGIFYVDANGLYTGL